VASLQNHLRDVREDAARQAAARDVLQAELRAATDAQRRAEEARHQAEQRAATESFSLQTQVIRRLCLPVCIVTLAQHTSALLQTPQAEIQVHDLSHTRICASSS
jgi:hypothetical protein